MHLMVNLPEILETCSALQGIRCCYETRKFTAVPSVFHIAICATPFQSTSHLDVIFNRWPILIWSLCFTSGLGVPKGRITW